MNKNEYIMLNNMTILYNNCILIILQYRYCGIELIKAMFCLKRATRNFALNEGFRHLVYENNTNNPKLSLCTSHEYYTDIYR